MKKIIFICVIILFVLFLQSLIVFTSDAIAANEYKVSLHGPWKISYDDRKEFRSAEFDDSSWEIVKLPGSFIASLLEKTGKHKGIVWLRKTVYISEKSEGDSLGLLLGRISNSDETYFNGVKVGGLGSFPPDDHSMWNFPRNYLIPSNCIRYGKENTIAVRVFSWLYGDMVGELSISDFQTFQETSNSRQFAYVTLPLLVISMALLLLFIFSAFFIARPREQEYLFYCLQIIFGFFIVYDQCALWNIYSSGYFRFQVLGIFWVGIIVVHLIFLHRIYNMVRKKTEVLLWSFLAVWVVIVFLAADSNPVIYAILLIASCTSFGFYHLYCHIYALYKKRPYSKVFSAFGIVVICCSMHDSFVYASKFTGYTLSIGSYIFDSLIFHYGGFSLFVGTALVLVVRFLLLRDEVSDLNYSLEQFIIENAILENEIIDKNMLGEKKPDNKSILTDSTVEKIRKVIEYIEGNYVDNLSREGLAASVDLHPDNLSKMFNAYKDMRIGDYINELRIQEAAQRLIASEESVTDIAFSVGFESLRTFNRAFLKCMNITPEKYRKKQNTVIAVTPDQ